MPGWSPTNTCRYEKNAVWLAGTSTIRKEAYNKDAMAGWRLQIMQQICNNNAMAGWISKPM